MGNLPRGESSVGLPLFANVRNLRILGRDQQLQERADERAARADARAAAADQRADSALHTVGLVSVDAARQTGEVLALLGRLAATMKACDAALMKAAAAEHEESANNAFIRAPIQRLVPAGQWGAVELAGVPSVFHLAAQS